MKETDVLELCKHSSCTDDLKNRHIRYRVCYSSLLEIREWRREVMNRPKNSQEVKKQSRNQQPVMNQEQETRTSQKPNSSQEAEKQSGSQDAVEKPRNS